MTLIMIIINILIFYFIYVKNLIKYYYTIFKYVCDAMMFYKQLAWFYFVAFTVFIISVHCRFIEGPDLLHLIEALCFHQIVIADNFTKSVLL